MAAASTAAGTVVACTGERKPAAIAAAAAAAAFGPRRAVPPGMGPHEPVALMVAALELVLRPWPETPGTCRSNSGTVHGRPCVGGDFDIAWSGDRRQSGSTMPFSAGAGAVAATIPPKLPGSGERRANDGAGLCPARIADEAGDKEPGDHELVPKGAAACGVGDGLWGAWAITPPPMPTNNVGGFADAVRGTRAGVDDDAANCGGCSGCVTGGGNGGCCICVPAKSEA
mmetsp:Transcript_113957/g.327445  ORF Transcript_113957/g.327445 Transcript_113957/m.327445 type:complete len:228 (+) Transcript_113957:93-776(+)